MRAAVLNEQKSFDIVDHPDPTPGATDLVLRVEACGICGSDLKAAPGMPVGLIMGHEFCGEIVAVGRDAVGSWKVGDRVASLPLIGCGACLACLQGDVVHCARGADAIGVGGSSGAYAEFIKVGSHETFHLPESFARGDGALVEPLAVGLHAVDRAQLQRGDNVLIIGGGPVGMAVTLWARHFGAREIIVSDPVAARRDQCGQLGATGGIDPSAGETARDAFQRKVGRLADVVFECVGVPGMVQASIDGAVVHGKVVIVGVCSKPDTFVPIGALMKELTMHFVIYYRSADYRYTIDMLHTGRIDALPMVSDRIGLDAFPAMFEALKHPTTQCKVLVVP
ncbi:MAG: alcohol dehydrogenase catalytic domain-containing protein [Acidimicrobiales bacterium]